MTDLKTGKQIVNEFFEGLISDQNLDKTIVNKLIELNKIDKFTATSVGNALEEIRKQELGNEVKKD